MEIVAYSKEYCPEIVNLFVDTVHTVNSADYSRRQLSAWAPYTQDMEKWHDSLSGNYAVAALENGSVVGFGDMAADGYLDRLYVHKNFQGMGIGKAICTNLENAINSKIYTTHASITAKPFFEKMGYEVIKQQTVERNGEKLTNFVMKKVNKYYK